VIQKLQEGEEKEKKNVYLSSDLKNQDFKIRDGGKANK
jgi:hypothetical protein